MLRLTERGRDDAGVVALIISFFFGSLVFVGIAALVIDIGAMQLERRQLQNSAEAAAGSAAFDCSVPSSISGGTCGSLSTATAAVANHNAADQLVAVDSGDLCGQGSGLLTACTRPRTVRDCPTTPTNARWVQVTASTLTTGGGRYLPEFFTRFIPGFGPRSVIACAQAAWGAPAATTSIMTPFTISGTCWQAQTKGVSNYGPTTWSGAAAQAWETVTTSTYTSSSSPGAATSICGTSTPGGFGSLNTVANNSCTVSDYLASPYTTWLTQQSGNSIPCPDVSAMLGKIVSVPIYDCAYQVASGVATATGYQYDPATQTFPTACANASVTAPNGIYFRIVGMAAYFMAGYDFGGNGSGFYSTPGNPNLFSKSNEPSVCKANQNCIFGWYTQQALITSGNIDDTAPYFGYNVVKLVG